MARFVFDSESDNKTDDSGATAIVTSFSNGRLKLDKLEGVRVGYFCNSSAKFAKQHEKILVAETDEARYVGRNFGPDAINAPTVCRYMLGVRDKQTNKVRLVDATMLHLRPSMEDSDDEDKGDEVEQTNEDDLTYVEKHARLTEEFGTAKGKRLIEARMRNKVKSQSLETVIASAMKDSAAVLSTGGQSGSSDSPAAIPPHNRDATQPEDVYVLDDLITPAEMVALMGPASVFVSATFDNVNEWLENGTYPGYVMHQLSMLPVQGSLRQHRSAILLYWTYLHRLLHECNKQTNDSSLLTDVPTVIRRSLFDRFTQMFGGKHGKSIRKMPARKKDLLRSYMLVLCLILEEFSLDFTALQRDLDVSLPQLEKCFQALGCKTSRHTSKAATGQTTKSFKASLVVPLTFPAYKARAGRR